MCLVIGGLVALIAGAIFYAAATAVTGPQIAWPLLLVLGLTEPLPGG